MKSAFFVSDVHLRSMASPHGEAILSLVKRAQSDAAIFVILGDLFDIWVGAGSAFQRAYAPLIDELKILAKSSRLLYFEGNHDFHLKDFWQDKVGAQVFTGPKLIEFNAVKIWCEHGDEIDRDDRGYLFLRWLFRTKPLEFLGRHAPSKLIYKIGNNMSVASREYTSRKSNRSREIFRRYAESVRRDTDFDVMVTGHTHLADDFSFGEEGARARLINLGSWFDGPHYLRVRSKTDAEIVQL